MHKSADVHHQHKSLGYFFDEVICQASEDLHLVLHQTRHNLLEYWVLIKPIISDKCHAQYLLDDLDQLILTNVVLLQGKGVVVMTQYHLGATS